MRRRIKKVSKKKMGKLGTAEDFSKRNEVKDFFKEAETAILQANIHQSRDSPPMPQARDAAEPKKESKESPIPMEIDIENSTVDESTVVVSNSANVEDATENTDAAATFASTDGLAISRDAPLAIDDRIKALTKAADEFYDTERYDEAMLHYTEVLLVAKPLCEQKVTSVSDEDEDKQILYQEVIAKSHAQIGNIKYTLGDPMAAMDEYCVAVAHYQIYRDWLALQLKEPNFPDEAKTLRSFIDKADNTMGALLTKMGQIQMKLDNLNWLFAMELSETALRVFKNLRMRIITNVGGGVITRDEVEDRIITLLDMISELHSIQGDEDAARRAESEASRLERRGEERGGTSKNLSSLGFGLNPTEGLSSLKGRKIPTSKESFSYKASRIGWIPNSFASVLSTTTTLLTCCQG